MLLGGSFLGEDKQARLRRSEDRGVKDSTIYQIGARLRPNKDGSFGPQRTNWWVLWLGTTAVAAAFDADVQGAEDAARYQLLAHIAQAVKHGARVGYNTHGVSLVDDGGILPLPASWREG